MFKFVTKSVGSLKKIVLAHVSKQDDPPKTREERNAPWTCLQVVVKDLGTGTSYLFPVMDTLILDQDPKLYKLETKKESLIVKSKSLSNIKYDLVVVTGGEKGSACSIKHSLIFLNLKKKLIFSHPKRLKCVCDIVWQEWRLGQTTAE